MKAQLHIAHLLDVGKTRSVQQDQLVCGYLDNEKSWQFDISGTLATDTSLSILSDGMGGTASGEIASGLVVDVIREYISDYFPQEGPGDVKLLLLSAVEAANKAVKQHVHDYPKDLNMGATVVVCLVTDEIAHVVWVGDSRCYKLSAGKMKQLTKDHSLVQRLIEAGEISTEQAVNHPKKNIITQSLSGKQFEADYAATSLKEGESLLICSDGLTGMLSDDEIQHEILTQSPDLAVKQLVHKANIAGGLDNISIILLKRPVNLREVIQDAVIKKQVVKKKSRKNQVWTMGVMLLLMCGLFVTLNIWQKPNEQLSEAVKISEPIGMETLITEEESQEELMTDGYPESGPGNQKFYIRLGTFTEASTADQFHSTLMQSLPSEDDLTISNIDTIYELKTRFFPTRREAQNYLATYLSQNEGIIINASNE